MTYRRLMAAAAVVAVVLTSATVASAQGDYLWLNAAKKAEVVKALGELRAQMNRVGEATKAAVRDSGAMNALLVHYEPSWQTNYWGLTDDFRKPIEALQHRVKSAGVYDMELHNLLTRLSGRFKDDWGGADISKRTAVVVELNDVVKKVVACCDRIEKLLVCTDPEYFAVLDEAGQIRVYSTYARLLKALEELQAKVAEDCGRAFEGGFTSIEHVDPGLLSANRWQLKAGYRTALEKETSRIWGDHRAGQMGTLEAVSFKGKHAKAYDAVKFINSKVIGYSESARSRADLGRAQTLLMNLRDYNLPEAIRLVKGELELFNKSVPNAQAIIQKANAAGAGESILAGAGSGTSTASSGGSSGTGSGTGSGTATVAPTDGSILGVREEQPVTTGGTTTTPVGSGTTAGGTTTTAPGAASTGSHQIAPGETLGHVAISELYQKFIEAGWKPNEIPFLWDNQGLVAALGRANNIDDWRNAQIVQGQTLTVPVVPQAPANAQERRQAYEQWFSGLGSGGSTTPAPTQSPAPTPTPTPAPTQPSSVPPRWDQNRGVEHCAEAIKGETQSFLQRFVPLDRVRYYEDFNRYLLGAPAAPANRSFQNNAQLLWWSTGVILQRIEQVTSMNGGRTPLDLQNLQRAAQDVRRGLQGYDPQAVRPGQYDNLKPLAFAVQDLHRALANGGGVGTVSI